MGTQLPWKGHIPTQLPQKVHSPQFLARVYCDQTAGLIKMPFAMEVGLGPGDIVLDDDPVPPSKRAQQPTPTFQPMSTVA